MYCNLTLTAALRHRDPIFQLQSKNDLEGMNELSEVPQLVCNRELLFGPGLVLLEGKQKS